ncbi:ninein-like protein isoform X3 [Artemia franciscana]|uniref:ninein-like protein isoform X3 n=1 Tax=Artemia franciscana TaxID=6661 RepID=UPI0032DB6E85
MIKFSINGFKLSSYNVKLNTFDYLTIIMDSMENGDPQNLSESSLQTELKAFLENGIARSETEAMALGKFLKAASTFFNQEVSALRSNLEQTTAERDKFYNDLIEANNRAQMLAQEIDDRHANIEKESLKLIRTLEVKHGEQIKYLQEELEAERDSSLSRWQQEKDDLVKQLNMTKEVEMQLKSSMDLIQKDNDKLLKELGAMNELINNLETGKAELEKELETYIFSQTVSMKSHQIGDSVDGQMSPSVIAAVVEENRRLRDTNDELQAELETTKSRLSRSRSSDLSRSVQSFSRRCDSADYDSDPETSQLRSRKLRKSVGISESIGDLRGDLDNKEGQEVFEQSIATQLFMAKRSSSFESLSKLKGKLVKVLERWKAHFNEDSSGSCSSTETLREKHESFLQEIENKLIEAAATESVLVAQLEDLKQKYEQLQDIQQVVEYEAIPLSYQEEERFRNLERLLVSTTERLRNKEEECMNLSSDLNEYKKRLRHIEGTVEEAVKQEMEPYKHTLEQHQKQMLDKCAELHCRIEEATHIVNQAIDKEKALSSVQSIKVEVATKIKELESNSKKFVDSFPKKEMNPVDSHSSICDKMQCSEIKTELDRIKFEILKMIVDKEELMKNRIDSSDIDKRIEERVTYETELLQKRIRELNQTVLDQKEKSATEKRMLEERTKELEHGLDTLKEEYDDLDIYWQQKIEEERDLFKKERDIMDEKFNGLQVKIKELEELVYKAEEKSDTDSLSTIDERSTFEKQVVDLEEENNELRRQISFYQSESSRVSYEEDIPTAKLQESVESLKNQLQYNQFNYETQIENLQKQIEEYETEKEILMTKHSCELKSLQNKLKPYSKNEFSAAVFNANSQKLKLERRSDTVLCQRPSSPIPSSSHLTRMPIFSSQPPPAICNKLFKSLTIEGRTACRIELSVLQNLNHRLKHLEERVKQLDMALKFQQQATDRILTETRLIHESELNQLERIMNVNQEVLAQQITRYQAQTEKLVAAESVVQELYRENVMLLQALDSVRSTLSVTVCM